VGVARRWVFPILRMLLIAIIAVALAKLAFFPDRPVEEDGAVPTGAVIEPVLPVTLGTITNDVVVDATVSADPAVPVKTTAAGTVNRIFAEVGATVAQDDVIFDVKVEIVRDPANSVDAEGKPLPAIFRYEDVTAARAGILSSLDVISGQSVSIGQVAGQIAPPTFSVSGSLQPAQQYRLLNQPTEASVAITGGPAPFTCTGLRITTPLSGAGAGTSSGSDGAAPGAPAGGGGTTGGGTTISCPVPDGVTVFPGLAAEMTVAGGRAENVLVVPTTAVRGAAQSGTVWVVAADGAAPEERPVSLGLSDGQQVQVVEGLAEGETVREFAPGAQAAVPGMEGCVESGGGVVCGVGG
jgi:membrane fusion protein, macrolide-specific efflux system